tara:strand:+ start:15279 stop:15566 length:288 start_codon:yes stop_codon:yes gene_type:complete
MFSLVNINELPQWFRELGSTDWFIIDVVDPDSPTGFKSYKVNKSTLGFPVNSGQTYTARSFNFSRYIEADVITHLELADLVATLITDLQTAGVID